jgi:DNA-binding NtrC family response regulator
MIARASFEIRAENPTLRLQMGDVRDEYSTIAQRPFDPTPPPELSFRIVVRSGVDADRSITIDDATPGRVYVGSAEGCELCVSDRAVSRRHFSAALEGDALRITDLGSTNGTSVNGVRVRDAFLAGGESVHVGSTTLAIERRAPTALLLSGAVAFGRMLGASREMRRLYPLCERLAAADVPVIIGGETGTGKEVLAESIHEASARAAGPFVVLDCTTIAPSLIESVLFGHERGAFTGATTQQVGVFEEASGGTLFIDEIGDLDSTLQPKLLRAIERGEVRRVGGKGSIKVDVRVIAATRRNLDAEIEAGRFRDDLFHRLAVGRIELPPLRARRGDVVVLVDAFCLQQNSKIDRIPPALLARWELAEWPGNVRELRNAVARFVSLGDEAGPSSASASASASQDDVVGSALASNAPFLVARQHVIDEFERRYVAQLLAAHDGNVTRAASASGIARRNFQLLRARTEKTGR